jgi:Flp pilus assembly protein CpaB
MGGFLVAVAALASTSAQLQASQPPAFQYVVAAQAVAPGATLTPADLTLASADLPASLQDRVFRHVAELQGATALGPLGAGELVQRSSVSEAAAAGDRPASQPEVALALDRAAAVDGALLPGERVDLLATYGTGDAAYTVTVARSAQVRLNEHHDTGGLGASGTITLTVAVADRAEVIAAVHAAQSGAITVVRTTGVDPTEGGRDSAGPPAEPYRPEPVPQRGAVSP